MSSKLLRIVQRLAKAQEGQHRAEIFGTIDDWSAGDDPASMSIQSYGSSEVVLLAKVVADLAIR